MKGILRHVCRLFTSRRCISTHFITRSEELTDIANVRFIFFYRYNRAISQLIYCVVPRGYIQEAHIRFQRSLCETIGFQINLLSTYIQFRKLFLSNMTINKLVTGMKMITGNRDVDFVNLAPFEVND